MQKTNFAKRLCGDDANLIEVIEVDCGNDTATQFVNEVLDQNSFKEMYRNQIEKMSAVGTVGAYVYLDDADIYEDGTFDGGNIKIQYVDAENIIPLTVINNKIIECAFSGHDVEKNKNIYILVIFTLENGKYKFEKHVFDEYGHEITEKKQDGELGEVRPFAIMRTAEVNNLPMKGYGYPKLISSIPSLEIVDLTMSMWHRDLDKSDKVVLVNENLAQRTEDGEVIPPTKEMKKIFVQIGEEKLPQQGSMYQEYNPSVRISEVTASMELALSILTLSFGFGTKKYTFENGRIVTATEYIGENQDAMQSVNKQRDVCEIYIKNICKAIEYFSNITLGDISIDFDDSYIEDKPAKLERTKNDALTFGIPKLLTWYLMDAYNLSEEEALELQQTIPMAGGSGDGANE